MLAAASLGGCGLGVKSTTDHTPVAVGSYPEPFLHGIGGLRVPVRIECAQLEGGPCQTVRARLRAAGVRFGLAELGPAGEEPDTLRLLVGTWRQVREDPGAQSLEHGPAASGVYARVAASGRAIALLDAQGATVRTLGSAGLIAATRPAEEDPEWLITGTDPAALQLAADDLDKATLHGRLAVALSETGAVLALPQPSPSQPSP